MVKKSGTANLPLHHGRVPAWLGNRMTALGASIAEAIILNEGAHGFLTRLSDPNWFQALGAVMGMDWHSSGITTSVIGALKRGLNPRFNDLGIQVCGGRGKHSLKTPAELLTFGDHTGLDAHKLVRASKLTAKVDNTAVQDGYALYLHGFFVTSGGDWVVVQQGMNDRNSEARRYHWRSDNIESFVEEPHNAMVGVNEGKIINLTDRRAGTARATSVDMLNESPDKIVRELQLICQRHLQMPHHHEIKPTDVFLRRLHGVLATARENNATGFESLLATKGLGPRTMQALALVSEVAYGAPSRFDDPARFAFSHGGKDGHPHPVPLQVYDQSIHHLRDALNRAKMGENDKINAFKNLDRTTRQLEQTARGPSFERLVDNEWDRSRQYGGMTVMGPASDAVETAVRGPRQQKTNKKQLVLF